MKTLKKKIQLLLTKLSEIDAGCSILHNFILWTHFPEESENEGHNAQETENHNPDDFQYVCDDHENCARYSSTNTWTPSSVHFVTCCAWNHNIHQIIWTSHLMLPSLTCCETSNEENHESKCSHRYCNDDKDHLNSFNPWKLQVEYMIKHDEWKWGASIHSRTENSDTDEQHYCLKKLKWNFCSILHEKTRINLIYTYRH